MVRVLGLLLVLLAATTHAAPRAKKPANILFLMCDSMDGRVLDPTSPVSQRMEMPNLRKLASIGTNFVRTYAASPQCVPSRTTMFAGRRIDQVRTWNNDQGLAAAPGPGGALDPSCLKNYDEARCAELAAAQGLKSTLADSLQGAGCELCIFGKVDVGAGIIEHNESATAGWIDGQPGPPSGFHSGTSLNTQGRAADIRKPTKPTPISITNDHDNNVHPEDQKMVKKCAEWFESHDPGAPAPWFHYCRCDLSETNGECKSVLCTHRVCSAAAASTSRTRLSIQTPPGSRKSRRSSSRSRFGCRSLSSTRRTSTCPCQRTCGGPTYPTLRSSRCARPTTRCAQRRTGCSAR